MNKLKFEQFAIGSFHYPRYPLCYFLDSVQRLGVKNIELWGVAPHLYVDDLTGADVKAIKREIDARGLRLICYCPEQNTCLLYTSRGLCIMSWYKSTLRHFYALFR